MSRIHHISYLPVSPDWFVGVKRRAEIDYNPQTLHSVDLVSMHFPTVKSVGLQNTWSVTEEREAKLAGNDLLGLECQVKGVWPVVPNLTKFYNHEGKMLKYIFPQSHPRTTEQPVPQGVPKIKTS